MRDIEQALLTQKEYSSTHLFTFSIIIMISSSFVKIDQLVRTNKKTELQQRFLTYIFVIDARLSYRKAIIYR